MGRYYIFGAKLVVTVTLLVLALRHVDFSVVLHFSNPLSWAWIILALAFAFAQLFLGAVRWCEVCAASGLNLTLRRAFQISVIGAFFNQVLPSSVGGDAARIWLVRADTNWRTAAHSVLIDRVVGFAVLALMVGISLPWTVQLISDTNARLALCIVDGLSLFAVIAFLFIGCLPRSLFSRSRIAGYLHECSAIMASAVFSWGRGLRLIALSVAIHFFAVAIAWCSARSIAAPISFGDVFILVPPVMLVTLVPISIAGWGIRETMMSLAFGYAGLANADGAAISVLFGLVVLVLGLAGGYVWVGGFRTRHGDLVRPLGVGSGKL